MSGWPADDRDGQESLVRRLYGRLIEGVHELRASLETRGRSARMATDEMGIPVIEVVVDASGKVYGPREASARLARIHQDLSETYTVRVRETLDELLGSTFLEHLRGRVGATDALVEGINRVLAQHPVVTTKTSLRIRLEPASESDGRMLAALRGPSLVNPEAAAHVREHLRLRVEAAKREAASHGEADWRERLVEALDYRRWFEVHLQRKIGQSGTWRPLTTQSFAEMSGGARAVVLMLPLVATLAALYADMDGAPRPLWLDEAFDGLDSANRAMVMDLFRSFDLDVLLAGPNRLVNVSTVPAAAIYQVVRAPAPLPGADLTLELWAGATSRWWTPRRSCPGWAPDGAGCRRRSGDSAVTGVPDFLVSWARCAGPRAVLAEARDRLERGRLGVRAKIDVPLSPAERTDVGKILDAAWAQSGGPVRVRDLRRGLEEHGVTLEGLLTEMGGPLRDLPGEARRGQEAASAAQRDALSELRRLLGVQVPAGLEHSVTEALARWVLRGAPDGDQVAEVGHVVRGLPDDGVEQLAVLAARLFSDAHALDRTRSLGRAVARFLAIRAAVASAGGSGSYDGGPSDGGPGSGPAPAFGFADPVATPEGWRECGRP